jgi:RNA polymerase sigma factor (TIGR02999 family)
MTPDFAAAYENLRRIAAARLSAEVPGHTLTATALVHEAYLRLADFSATDSAHLLAAAAEVIRHVLVDRARAKGRLKRDRRRVPLPDLPAAECNSDDVLDLAEALDALAEDYPEHAKLVQLRFFGGLSAEEAAQALGLAKATADRRWAFARAWLHEKLSQNL